MKRPPMDTDSTEERKVVPMNKPLEPELEQPHYYYLAAVKILYVRDERVKERTVNVVINLNAPAITQTVITNINNSAAQRVARENEVDENDIHDAIIMSVSFIGAMPPTMFNNANSDQTIEHRED